MTGGIIGAFNGRGGISGVDWPSIMAEGTGMETAVDAADVDVIVLEPQHPAAACADTEALLDEVGPFGKFQKAYLKCIIFPTWFFSGAFMASMSFAAQEPPRFPVCAAGVALQQCNPNKPLSPTDCLTPYFYPHHGLTVVSEFNVTPRVCSSAGLLAGTTWTSSAFFLGFLMGAMLLGRLGDAMGRRRAILLAVYILEFAGLMLVFSGSIIQYGLARLILGFGVGGAGLLTFVLFTEFTPAHLRGLLTVAQSSSFALGCAYTCCATAVLPGWRSALAVVALPGLVLLFFPFRSALLEGPRWLATRGFGTRAVAVWRAIGLHNGHKLSDHYTGELLVELARSGGTEHTPARGITKCDGQWQSVQQLEGEPSLPIPPVFMDSANESPLKAFTVAPLNRWAPVLLLFWLVSAMSYYGIYFQTNFMLSTTTAALPTGPPAAAKPAAGHLPAGKAHPAALLRLLDAITPGVPAPVGLNAAASGLASADLDDVIATSTAAPSPVSVPEPLSPRPAPQVSARPAPVYSPVSVPASASLRAAPAPNAAEAAAALPTGDPLLVLATTATDANAGVAQHVTRAEKNVIGSAAAPLATNASREVPNVIKHRMPELAAGVLDKLAAGVNSTYIKVADAAADLSGPMGDAAKALQYELGKGYRQVKDELAAVPVQDILSQDSPAAAAGVLREKVFYNFFPADPSYGFIRQRRRQIISTLISFLLEIPWNCATVYFACCRFCGRKGAILASYLLACGACCAAYSVRLPALAIPSHLLFPLIAILSTAARLLIGGGFLLLYVYSSEIFPTAIRAGAIGLCSTAARVGGIAAPVVVDNIESTVSGGALLWFAAFAFTAFVLGAVVMPETLGWPLRDTVTQLRRDFAQDDEQKRRRKSVVERGNLLGKRRPSADEDASGRLHDADGLEMSRGGSRGRSYR